MPAVPSNADSPSPPAPDVSPLLDQFDEAWQKGQPPRIEEYLARFGQRKMQLRDVLARIDAELAGEDGLRDRGRSGRGVVHRGPPAGDQSSFGSVGPAVPGRPITTTASLVEVLRQFQLLNPP